MIKLFATFVFFFPGVSSVDFSNYLFSLFDVKTAGNITGINFNLFDIFLKLASGTLVKSGQTSTVIDVPQMHISHFFFFFFI